MKEASILWKASALRTRPLCCVLRGFSKDSQSDWLRVNLIQTKNPEFYYLQIIQNWFTFTLDVATQMQFSQNKKATLHNLIIPAIHWVVIFIFFAPKYPVIVIPSLGLNPMSNVDWKIIHAPNQSFCLILNLWLIKSSEAYQYVSINKQRHMKTETLERNNSSLWDVSR